MKSFEKVFIEFPDFEKKVQLRKKGNLDRALFPLNPARQT